MAANKTVETSADVSAFVAGIEDERQRVDAMALVDMFSRVSGEPPKMWGPSIIGFGTHRYRYESGREGEICRIGFSPRQGKTVLYGMDIQNSAHLLDQLGKHSTGKGCLNLKRLGDVDAAVLEQMAAAALAAKTS